MFNILILIKQFVKQKIIYFKNKFDIMLINIYIIIKSEV